MSESHSAPQRVGWETRVERLLKCLVILCGCVLVCTLANAAATWQRKSLLEQRVELLERARADQQKRNDAVDEFLNFVLKKLKG